jgi:HK97 family phage major capsid protein
VKNQLEHLLKSDLPGFAKLGEGLVKSRRQGRDVGLSALAKEHFGLDDTGEFLDIVARHTDSFDPAAKVASLVDTLPAAVSWIVPEVIREAIQRGVRKQAIYPDLTAFSETVSQTSVTMPKVNVGAAEPAIRGEGEVIPTSSITYGQKTVYIKERSAGFEGTRELVKYSSLDFLANWFSSFGIRYGHALDGLWIDCLLNGDLNEAGGAYLADTPPPEVGAHSDTTGLANLAYEDILYIVARMTQCGFNPTVIICNEASALALLDMDEFKVPYAGSPILNLDTKGFKIPAQFSIYIHGDMPAQQFLFVDPSQALVQFTSAEMEIERDYAPKTRIFGEYVTFTTGPAVLQPGARVLFNKAKTVGAPDNQDFPATYVAESLTL